MNTVMYSVLKVKISSFVTVFPPVEPLAVNRTLAVSAKLDKLCMVKGGIAQPFLFIRLKIIIIQF